MRSIEEDLKLLSLDLYPDFADQILLDSSIADSHWGKDTLKTGKALEALTLLALCHAFALEGHHVNIPKVYKEKPHFFYLRNSIPLHHGARPGHAGSSDDCISISDRFLAAMTPKVTVTCKSGLELSIFREGNPFHEIMAYFMDNAFYPERPDLIVSEGECRSSVSHDEMYFGYTNGTLSIKGSLSIRNSIEIPLKDFQIKGNGEEIPTSAIIECSVSKSTQHAFKQMERYHDIFKVCPGRSKPYSMFVNGASKGNPNNYDTTLNLNLRHADSISLKKDLIECSAKLVKSLTA